MPVFSSWLDTTGDRTTVWSGNMYDDVTVQADNIIRRKPNTIMVHTRFAGGDLPGTQVVRIEPLNDPSQVVGDAVNQSDQWIVVIGFKDNTDEDDTDLKRNDEFTHEGVLYKVHSVNVRGTIPGHLEAYCMAVR